MGLFKALGRTSGVGFVWDRSERISHALITARINLSPFTKDFRVTGDSNELSNVSEGCPRGNYYRASKYTCSLPASRLQITLWEVGNPCLLTRYMFIGSVLHMSQRWPT